MRRLATVVTVASLVGAAFMLSGAGGSAAGPEQPSAAPGIFDPGNTGTVASAWVKHLGEPDPNDLGDTDRYALILSKNATTATNSSAYAVIENVRGIHLTEIGFDIKNGSHCGAGAPRFNVVTTDGVFHFVGGCSNGTITPATPEPGWSRVRIDPNNPAQSFPVVTPTETVKSIAILSDEGTDTGPDFSGQSVVDNIDINTILIGAPEGSS
jgi:hypothetical protein